MFGHYFRKLDDKNRVMIPSKLKNSLSKVSYITVDFDNILTIRDNKSFAEWSSKLINLNSLNVNARKFARALLGRTYEIELDKQGRIAIPSELITSSDLTKEIAFIGVGDKIEIHSKAAFDKMQKEISKARSLDDLAKKLLDKGAEL